MISIFLMKNFTKPQFLGCTFGNQSKSKSCWLFIGACGGNRLAPVLPTYAFSVQRAFQYLFSKKNVVFFSGYKSLRLSQLFRCFRLKSACKGVGNTQTLQKTDIVIMSSLKYGQYPASSISCLCGCEDSRVTGGNISLECLCVLATNKAPGNTM